MHQTEIIFSILVISAFTVSAKDNNETTTFQETKSCELDSFEILLKFAEGLNFTKKESETWNETISGNSHNLTEIVRVLQCLVNHKHDNDTSQHTTNCKSPPILKSNIGVSQTFSCWS